MEERMAKKQESSEEINVVKELVSMLLYIIFVIAAVWFILTFPLFDIIGRIATFIAFFKKVEWKPIPHNSSVTIDDIHPESEKVTK